MKDIKITVLISICFLALLPFQVHAMEVTGTAPSITAEWDEEDGTEASLSAVYKRKLRSVRCKGVKVNWNRRLPRRYKKKYHKMQGCTTDGKYVYINYGNNYDNRCVMIKANARTFHTVKISKPLKIMHGNDMTYNSRTKKLYVVDNEKNPFVITVISPKTLRITGHKRLKIPKKLKGLSKKERKNLGRIVGITYSRKKRRYALRISGGNDFVVTNEKFKVLRYVSVEKDFRPRPQGMDSDDKHILISMDKVGHSNTVAVYNWKGKFLYRIRFSLKTEIQDVYHIGKTFYASFYDKKGPSGYIYTFRAGRSKAYKLKKAKAAKKAAKKKKTKKTTKSKKSKKKTRKTTKSKKSKKKTRTNKKAAKSKKSKKKTKKTSKSKKSK